MDKIGDAQFHVMCEMWGVDAAIKAAKRMGFSAAQEQIEVERDKERQTKERWDAIFKEE